MHSAGLRNSLSIVALLAIAAACAGDRTLAPDEEGTPTQNGGVTTTTPPAGDLALVSPTEIAAGIPVVLTGQGFAATAAQNTVTLDGIPARVTAASPTSLTITAPPESFACAPAKTVTLSVSAGGRSAAQQVLLRTAQQAVLAAGESAVLDAQRCVELPASGSRYLVSVVNAGRAVSAVAPFELRGIVAGQTTASAAPVVTGALASAASGSWAGDRAGRATGTIDSDENDRRARFHHRILETSRGLRGRYGAAGRRLATSQVSASVGSADMATVSAGPTTTLQVAGDTATLRIPDINSSNACSKYFSVRTRVVYSTAHAIILEDVNAPLAGQMDATYRSIGDEFERVMWPLLTTNFGNPLAMDAKLDRNGKIVMLFSPVVNNTFPGIAGFVIGCDFYSRTQAPSSNEGEVFYATVPTSATGTVTSATSRDGWRRSMRSTIIHEAKHITAYAERFSRGHDLEEAWLEEGTARHSEELYARALVGGSWKGNAGYQAIACEVRPTVTGCTDRPYVMYKHFDGLSDYLAQGGSLSPLGQTHSADYNYYASAWALVRWAADLAPDEATFFRTLTRGPTSGVGNLEAAAARPWAEILSDWTMSLALDDYAGFTPARAQKIGTWNLQDVFAGMNKDFPSAYVQQHPMKVNAAKFGSFTVTVPALRGGSGAVTELTGAWAGSQVLELRLPGGGAPAGTLRLAVTRVQ